eukprot:191955-Hanusia_phi.AAC.1
MIGQSDRPGRAGSRVPAAPVRYRSTPPRAAAPPPAGRPWLVRRARAGTCRRSDQHADHPMDGPTVAGSPGPAAPRASRMACSHGGHSDTQGAP